jgi:signal transduction histidine kinase
MLDAKKLISADPVRYTLRMRRAVFTGFFILVTLISSLALFAYDQVKSANASMAEVVRINNHKTSLYYAMRISARERIIALYRVLQTEGMFERDEEAQRHSKLAAEFIHAREELERLHSDETESSLFAELSQVLKTTQPLQAQVIELALWGEDQEAERLLADAKAAQQTALVAIDRLLDEQERRNRATLKVSERAYSNAIRYLWLLAAITLLVGGLITSYVWIKVGKAAGSLLRNNESLRKANRDLEIANEKAESAAIAKSEFVANVSHEIRTPMTSVRGVLAMLKEGTLGEMSPNGRAMVEIANRNAEKLLVLLNDLLDFSRIEAGQMEIVLKETDLDRELADIKQLFEHQAHAKGLVVDYTLDANIGACVVLDPARVFQVLINLVGNAIKYTDTGGVSIDVRLKGNANKQILSFQVTDSGIGIAEGQQNAIFKKFVQGDGSATRKHGGTGLGLAISKRLVQLMSGEIGVRSAPGGKGSVFWFTVPYQTTDSRESASGQAANVTAMGPRSVLPDVRG